ncbi:MAG: hypothetical protein ACE5ES_05885 [Candidatus Nanoarchaeia archaeon]
MKTKMVAGFIKTGFSIGLNSVVAGFIKNFNLVKVEVPKISSEIFRTRWRFLS